MTEEPLSAWMIRLYIVLAATAGAVTGALIDKSLTLQGKCTAFFIGLTGSIFLGPLIVSRFFPSDTLTPQAAGLFYVIAASMNGSLPPLLKFISKKAGDPLSFIRTQGGGS